MSTFEIGQEIGWKQDVSIEIMRNVYDAFRETGRALFQVKKKEDGLIYALKVFDNALNDAKAIRAELVALNRQVNEPAFLPRFRSMFSAGEVTYVLMDWIEGESFDLITKGEPAKDRESIVFRMTMLVQLAKTLEKVHRARFIHRDIKPQNALLKNRKLPREGVAIVDFGSSIIKRNLEEGTLEYQAPEQAGRRNYNLGPAVDVFGLGQVGWYLFAGSPLSRFPNETVTDWSDDSIISLAPSLAGIAGIGELQNILLKALSYHPKDRYDNASIFLSAITNLQRRYFS